jgi:hypothetical protein
MGSIGDCYDNATIESLWGATVGLLNRKRSKTPKELANATFEHLEIFDHCQRRHAALGMRAPVDCDTSPPNPWPETNHHGNTEPGTSEPPPQLPSAVLLCAENRAVCWKDYLVVEIPPVPDVRWLKQAGLAVMSKTALLHQHAEQRTCSTYAPPTVPHDSPNPIPRIKIGDTAPASVEKFLGLSPYRRCGACPRRSSGK